MCYFDIYFVIYNLITKLYQIIKKLQADTKL